VEGFLARLRPAIVDLRANGDYPTMEKVAELADLGVDQVRRGSRRYGFPDWASVVQRISQMSS
jgi:hypothetical protein